MSPSPDKLGGSGRFVGLGATTSNGNNSPPLEGNLETPGWDSILFKLGNTSKDVGPNTGHTGTLEGGSRDASFVGLPAVSKITTKGNTVPQNVPIAAPNLFESATHFAPGTGDLLKEELDKLFTNNASNGQSMFSSYNGGLVSNDQNSTGSTLLGAVQPSHLNALTTNLGSPIPVQTSGEYPSIPAVTSNELDINSTLAALAAQNAQAYAPVQNPMMDSQVSGHMTFTPHQNYGTTVTTHQPSAGLGAQQQNLYARRFPETLGDSQVDVPYSAALAGVNFGNGANNSYAASTRTVSGGHSGLAPIQTNLPYSALSPTASSFSYLTSGTTAVQSPVTPFTPFTPAAFSSDGQTSPHAISYPSRQHNYPNWDAIVEQILVRCDQQCSMNMQQKLKTADSAELFLITQAIGKRAHELMTNRTGNFLVQRLLEHGPPEMTNRLAAAILGNVVSLSMNMFACHVIQKAFDCVSEDYKRRFVDELLQQIVVTIHNKFAAHVWQKIFELRWKGPAPTYMPFIIRDLKGQWTTVANGETGSLVVQNIFENCVDDDKRPVVDEILQNLEAIAKGQFGNWCIQHIVEHGEQMDREYLMNYLIGHAIDWSFDQYASKVVEKALKVGGEAYLDRYLDVVCEPESGRSRVPLVDISGDQYGNYLIQWVLCHGNDNVRNRIAGHIRRHMVSLRGSKYGSRVAIACTDWQSQTRPGPATGIQKLKNVGFGRNGGGQGPVGGCFEKE